MKKVGKKLEKILNFMLGHSEADHLIQKGLIKTAIREYPDELGPNRIKWLKEHSVSPSYFKLLSPEYFFESMHINPENNLSWFEADVEYFNKLLSDPYLNKINENYKFSNDVNPLKGFYKKDWRAN
jgi:hypothetical protein